MLTFTLENAKREARVDKYRKPFVVVSVGNGRYDFEKASNIFGSIAKRVVWSTEDEVEVKNEGKFRGSGY